MLGLKIPRQVDAKVVSDAELLGQQLGECFIRQMPRMQARAGATPGASDMRIRLYPQIEGAVLDKCFFGGGNPGSVYYMHRLSPTR